MKGSTFLKDDDVFEVLLSNEDYLELKEWKDKYNRLQIKLGEFEALSAEIITLKLALSQAQLQKTETQKSNQELKNVIGLISQCLNVKIEALLAQDKQSVPSKQGICSIKEKNHELRKNFTESQLTSQINELCEVYESRLKKQRQKSISITSQNTTLRNEVKNLEVQTVLLKNENRNTSLKVSELTRIKVEEGQNTSDRIQKIQSSLKNLSEENSALKKQLTQVQNKLANLSIQNQLLSEQNNQYCKETRELQDQIKQYQQHIRILKQSIQHQSKSKNHHITQKRYSPKRVEAQSPEKSKFQKQDYIKQTLIEYSRQIRKNLLKIGNLSQEEIKQIGASELDVLVKFIKELEEDFD